MPCLERHPESATHRVGHIQRLVYFDLYKGIFCQTFDLRLVNSHNKSYSSRKLCLCKTKGTSLPSLVFSVILCITTELPALSPVMTVQKRAFFVIFLVISLKLHLALFSIFKFLNYSFHAGSHCIHWRLTKYIFIFFFSLRMTEFSFGKKVFFFLQIIYR